MPGVQGVEQIERFAAAYLADDQAVGPMPESCFDQVANRHGRNGLGPGAVDLFFSRFEAEDVRMIDLQLGRVLDDVQVVRVAG